MVSVILFIFEGHPKKGLEILDFWHFGQTKSVENPIVCRKIPSTVDFP